MVYLNRWDDFETAAIELYKKSPAKVRYNVKFRPKDGELVLKITDDYKCLKFKSRSSIILNRFESLNLRLLLQMSSRPSTSTPSNPIASSSTTNAASAPVAGIAGLSIAGGAVGGEKDAEGDVKMGGGAGAGGQGKSAAGGSGGGGGKKKKKGKK